jgi:hypothetical protein
MVADRQSGHSPEKGRRARRVRECAVGGDAALDGAGALSVPPTP